jgi:hypothetical protein
MQILLSSRDAFLDEVGTEYRGKIFADLVAFRYTYLAGDIIGDPKVSKISKGQDTKSLACLFGLRGCGRRGVHNP